MGSHLQRKVAFVESQQSKSAVHFVWFRGDEYWSAVKVWGKPDYYHIGWDRRARREIAPGDVIVFARGEHDQLPCDRNFDDIRE